MPVANDCSAETVELVRLPLPSYAVVCMGTMKVEPFTRRPPTIPAVDHTTRPPTPAAKVVPPVLVAPPPLPLDQVPVISPDSESITSPLLSHENAVPAGHTADTYAPKPELMAERSAAGVTDV